MSWPVGDLNPEDYPVRDTGEESETVNAREQLDDAVERALLLGGDFDPNGTDDIVRRIVHGILSADSGEGWLIREGKIRAVQIADRFGPASWEISCHETPEDWESWRLPRG